MSYYTLKITGKRYRNFITLLVKLKIPFLKKKEGEDFVILEVSDQEYEKIKKMKTTLEITVIKRRGLAYFEYFLKTKKLFLLSIFCAFLFFTLLSNMIFSIRIVENDEAVRNRIEEDLETFGIERFHFKVSYQEKEKIRAKILEKEKDMLEWLEIEEIGTMYQVKLIKRVKKEEEKIEEPRHIIAKKNGMITKIEAEEGEVAVKKYQTVKKGDVLISGFIKNKETIKKKVPARGKVYAEVWYQVKMNLPTYYQEEKKTGKEKKVLEILFLNHNLFFSSLFPYQNSKEEQHIIYSNPLIPFKISYTKKEELEVTRITYNEQNMKEKVIPLAISKLKEKLGSDIIIVSEQVLKKKTTNGKFEVEIFFKVEEEISSYQSLKDVDIEEENKK